MTTATRADTSEVPNEPAGKLARRTTTTTTITTTVAITTNTTKATKNENVNDKILLFRRIHCQNFFPKPFLLPNVFLVPCSNRRSTISKNPTRILLFDKRYETKSVNEWGCPFRGHFFLYQEEEEDRFRLLLLLLVRLPSINFMRPEPRWCWKKQGMFFPKAFRRH